MSAVAATAAAAASATNPAWPATPRRITQYCSCGSTCPRAAGIRGSNRKRPAKAVRPGGDTVAGSMLATRDAVSATGKEAEAAAPVPLSAALRSVATEAPSRAGAQGTLYVGKHCLNSVP